MPRARAVPPHPNAPDSFDRLGATRGEVDMAAQFPAFAAGGLSRRRGMLERPSVGLRFSLFRRRKGRCMQKPGRRSGEAQKV
ncbi:MAG: hypothetical protein F4X91_07265 [Nitrospinae bacterium]|nr:hypothetical protein [Nitrospinota bacterium]